MNQRRYWVTGASSGIGAELAELLLNNGHRVALSARSLEPLQALAERYPQQVLVLEGDLSDSQQVLEIANRINSTWGWLDTAILNAGTCEYLDATAFDASLIERVLKTNLLATSYCIEAALPLLRKSQSPHLVAVASAVTYFPLPRAEAYGASKAALRYLLESLRLDLAHQNIDVTLVSPGFVDTPLTQKNDFTMPMRVSVETAAQHIVSRLDKRPYEIAFPWLFITCLRLLANLPKAVQVAIGKRMARAPSSGKDQT